MSGSTASPDQRAAMQLVADRAELEREGQRGEHRAGLADQLDERVAALDLAVRPVADEAVGDDLVRDGVVAVPELEQPALIHAHGRAPRRGRRDTAAGAASARARAPGSGRGCRREISCTPPRKSSVISVQTPRLAVTQPKIVASRRPNPATPATAAVDHAGDRGDRQRHVGERRHRLRGEPEQRAVRGAAAVQAPGPPVLDRHLLEPDPGDHPAQEAAALGHRRARCPPRAATSAGNRPPGPGRARAPAAPSACRRRSRAGACATARRGRSGARRRRRRRRGRSAACPGAAPAGPAGRRARVRRNRHGRDRFPPTSRPPCRSCARA